MIKQKDSRKAEVETQMKILFVSDYVCPYCLVAKEAMKQAAEELGIHPEITWHPFELTVEPAPRVDTYHDETRKAHYQVLVEPCRSLGLDMKLPPNVVPRPYTRLAFEGFYYAKAQGKEEEYNDLLYRAYFTEELDIGDPEVLGELAECAGLDREGFREALVKGTYREELAAANRHAREELHVTHVPTIFIDGKEVSVQEYTKEEFTDLFRRFQDCCGQEERNGETMEQKQEVHGCGPDGCSF